MNSRLPRLVILLTAVSVAIASGLWLMRRAEERRTILREHASTEKALAQTSSALIAPVLRHLGSDLERLARLRSMEDLDRPDRLEIRLNTFLLRQMIDSLVVIRVDTAGAVLFTRSNTSVPPQSLDILRDAGILNRAGGSSKRLLSKPVRVPGWGEVVALSNVVRPENRPFRGAVIAVFPLSALTNSLAALQLAEGRLFALRFGDETGGSESYAVVSGGTARRTSPSPEYDFVERVPVEAEVEPPLQLELRSTKQAALAPLRGRLMLEVVLLLLVNGLLVTAGGFLARELQLKGWREDNAAQRRELESRLADGQRMESIGRLAGGIAHDFNNLLTVILGSALTLQQRLASTDDVRDEADAIVQASQHAGGLTRQLLAIARRQTLHPQIVNLNTALHELEPFLRRMLPADVLISLDAGCERPWVCTDPVHFEQVILNLASNARDAMPQGGELRLSTGDAFITDHDHSRELKPGAYVRVTVEDTGSGIQPEVAARMFEPFFTTKPMQRGTGLGLATVKGIVAQSGGSIVVESRVGEGARFIIHFPVAAVAMAELRDAGRKAPLGRPAVAAVIAPVSAPERGVSTPAGKQLSSDGGAESTALTAVSGAEEKSQAKILVAEDNDAIRQLITRILSRAGYIVLTAASGEEALQIAAATPTHIDLLITDVVMAGMDGRELAERLAVGRPETGILFISGYMEDDILHRGVVTSSINFLEKPFTPSLLLTSVRSTLANS